MMVKSASPLLRIVSANSCWSAVKDVSINNPLMPIMAFIGVRISWLIIARKALLAWLASSACWRAASASALAWCSSCSASLRSLISRIVSIAPTISPFESRSVEAVAYK